LPKAKVLIIDDEIEVGTFFRRLLKKGDYDLTVVLNCAEANKALRETRFNVAMVDLKLPDTDGLTLLQQIKELQPTCEAIIMTGYSTTRTAVKAIQLGAFDYIEKPFDDIKMLENLIQKAMDYGNQTLMERYCNKEWSDIANKIGFQVGTSQVMHKLVTIAHKIAKKNINVLIQGETGTGKEVLARFIHAAGYRAKKAFIPVNCGAFAENLLESELFGHEKGSFTGAGSLRKGIFELANGGTLFLDEVGEASLAIQVKLLRVLETGEFLRVGGEKPVKTDVRVIAATNTNLEQLMVEKTFREDLFYRLDVVRLELPPLRERREDIPVMAEHFVKKLNTRVNITREALEILRHYHWPGNIRELANAIRQAVALCDGKNIQPENLNSKLTAKPPAPCTPHSPGPTAIELPYDPPPHSLEDLLEQYCEKDALKEMGEKKLATLADRVRTLENYLTTILRKKGSGQPPPSLEEIEAKAIKDALDYYQRNITMTARALGIGRNTLYRKIKDYNL